MLFCCSRDDGALRTIEMPVKPKPRSKRIKAYVSDPAPAHSAPAFPPLIPVSLSHSEKYIATDMGLAHTPVMSVPLRKKKSVGFHNIAEIRTIDSTLPPNSFSPRSFTRTVKPKGGGTPPSDLTPPKYWEKTGNTHSALFLRLKQSAIEEDSFDKHALAMPEANSRSISSAGPAPLRWFPARFSSSQPDHEPSSPRSYPLIKPSASPRSMHSPQSSPGSITRLAPRFVSSSSS
jgi:hypothetical protein